MADWRQNYNGTGAPMVVGNLVVSGIAGGDEGVRGFVAAYDQTTGKEVWRFWAVPTRGEPGAETWKGSAIDHPGAATWMTGSFDAELNTLYWAIGNPGPDMIGDERLGDNLYSDSVVALDPATGRLKWHFQFTPHDVHDYDAQQPLVLVDATLEGPAAQVAAAGEPQRLLLRAGPDHRRVPARNAVHEAHHMGLGAHTRGTADRGAEHGAHARRASRVPVARGRVELVLRVLQSPHRPLLRADQRQVRHLHPRGSGLGGRQGVHGRHLRRGSRARAARAASAGCRDWKSGVGAAAVRNGRIVGRRAQHRGRRGHLLRRQRCAVSRPMPAPARCCGVSRRARCGSRPR